MPLHIGDHLYISNTKKTLQAFNLIKQMYEKKIKLENWAIVGGIEKDQNGKTYINAPESILAKAFLKANNVPQKYWHDKENFQKYFEIFNINKTGKFLAQWQGKSIVYKDNFCNPHGIYNIEDCFKKRIKFFNKFKNFLYKFKKNLNF